MMMNLFFHGERSCPTASDYIHQKMFGIGSKDNFCAKFNVIMGSLGWDKYQGIAKRQTDPQLSKLHQDTGEGESNFINLCCILQLQNIQF